MHGDDIERLRRGEHVAPAEVPLPPLPEPELPPAPIDELAAADARALARPPWFAAVGAALLVMIAAIPHWLAPTLAVMVAATGIPIAWNYRRITTGRPQRLFIAITLLLTLTVALAITMPFVWVRLGLLPWPIVPLD